MNVDFLAMHESGTMIPTRLAYGPDTPLVVHMQFRPPEQEQVDWLVARDLLLTGCTACRGWVGDGDVQLRRDDTQLQMHLCTPDGKSSLRMPLSVVSGFLGRTLQTTPLGDELDDDALDQLVNSLLWCCGASPRWRQQPG